MEGSIPLSQRWFQTRNGQLEDSSRQLSRW